MMLLLLFCTVLKAVLIWLGCDDFGICFAVKAVSVIWSVNIQLLVQVVEQGRVLEYCMSER